MQYLKFYYFPELTNFLTRFSELVDVTNCKWNSKRNEDCVKYIVTEKTYSIYYDFSKVWDGEAYMHFRLSIQDKYA